MLPQRVERELCEGEAWDCYSTSQVELESPVKDIWDNTKQHQEKKYRPLIIDFIVKIILIFTKRIFVTN
ncbi:hypothetical protein RIVM261_046690 [Rivularia sp. IAM M-261]|nr:hypothetical protein RIVM261_046690 [Rivularia sp. IAM M-261]